MQSNQKQHKQKIRTNNSPFQCHWTRKLCFNLLICQINFVGQKVITSLAFLRIKISIMTIRLPKSYTLFHLRMNPFRARRLSRRSRSGPLGDGYVLFYRPTVIAGRRWLSAPVLPRCIQKIIKTSRI